MKIEISHNSISTYRTCPKKWYWSYVEKLKPRYKISALTLGSTIHEAFDKYYKGEKPQDIANWIDTTYKQQMSEVALEDQEQLYIDSKTCLGMFLNFPFQIMKFDKIESEVEFTVPLYYGIKFRGRIDGKVKIGKDLWVREVKTSGETRTMFENRASVSGQATGYVWAVQKLYGEKIAGVLFDYIRKPRLEKRVTEDMYQFAQRIYMDYCDLHKHSSYFYRYKTYRSPIDIAMWVSDTISSAKQLKKSIKDNIYPRNTGSCWIYNSECPFRRVCFETNPDPMIIDLLYERRTNGEASGSKADHNGSLGPGTGSNEALPGERSSQLRQENNREIGELGADGAGAVG